MICINTGGLKFEKKIAFTLFLCYCVKVYGKRLQFFQFQMNTFFYNFIEHLKPVKGYQSLIYILLS